MWNVYSIDKKNGTRILEAADCGSEELAWDVVDYMYEVENFQGILTVAYLGDK